MLKDDIDSLGPIKLKDVEAAQPQMGDFAARPVYPMNENTEPMAHEEAESTNAVEGYLLNELTEEERSRFEAHYFECQICADAVLVGQNLIEGIRHPIPWWRRAWWRRRRRLN